MTDETLIVRGDQAATELLDEAAIRWLGRLLQQFEPRLAELLSARQSMPAATAQDETPLLSAHSHPGDWQTVETPGDLRDRRVELNCGGTAGDLLEAMQSDATAVSVDLEESLPVRGHALSVLAALRDLLNGKADGQAGAITKPVIFGPRALQRQEPLLDWKGSSAPAALIDAGLYLYVHGVRLNKYGLSVCLRLSQLHSVEEAAFWRDVIAFAEDCEILQRGSVKACIAIETVPAVFACDGILHELRDYAAALTFDRHACLQSFIRTFPDLPQFILPDRSELSTAAHFLHCWGLVVIGTAHRRDTSAIGPCATYLPPPEDSESRVLEKLRVDKERHAHDGFDGSGVAHPGLCRIARGAFDRLMPGQHQHHRKREDVRITGADLLQVRKGKITENGLRQNLRVALHGLLAMDAGEPALALDRRRETATSVGFAADQLWQWRQHATGVLDDGRMIDDALIRTLLDDEKAGVDYPGDAIERATARLAGHLGSERLPGDLLQGDPV